MNNTQHRQPVKIITFDPASHTYKDEDKKFYTSATTVIGSYEKPFDKVGESIKYAQRYGNTPEYWMRVWDDYKDERIDIGNETHDFLEGKVNNITGETELPFHQRAITLSDIKINPINRRIDYWELENSGIKERFPIIYKRLKELLDNGWLLYTEKIVYWYEFLISGKIDLFAFNPRTLKFKIIDWKTNAAELKFVSGYYKKENGIKTDIWIDKDERMKYPLNHLQKCKGTNYSLQTSLYARMAENFGYIFDGIEIYHIHSDGTRVYSTDNGKIKYLRNDVESMAIHFAAKQGTGINHKDVFKIR